MHYYIRQDCILYVQSPSVQILVSLTNSGYTKLYVSHLDTDVPLESHQQP